MKKIYLLSLLIFCILCKCDIFVSPSGEDTSTCGTSDQPCKTIQFCIDNNNNTQLILMQGTYNMEAPLYLDQSKNITITSTNLNTTVLNSTNGIIMANESSIISLKNLTLVTTNYIGHLSGKANLKLYSISVSSAIFTQDIFKVDSGSFLTITDLNFVKDILLSDSFINNLNGSATVISSTFQRVILSSLSFL